MKENNISKNEYKSYDEWYSTLLVKYNNQVPVLENMFYKYQRAYEWILQHKTNFINCRYPAFTTINGRQVQLWYDLGMLKYTKMDRSFSMFQYNKDIGKIPYIYNNYILDFTTACHDELVDGYRYTYAEVLSAAEDLNHGAGDGSHFYLLPTQCSDKNLNEGLTDYFENLNRILTYGEFRHPEYEPLFRRGTKVNVSRSYDKYRRTSNEEVVQVTNINILTAILTKTNNDAIVKEQEENLTNANLLD